MSTADTPSPTTGPRPQSGDSDHLLTKGIEEEVYTGKRDATVVGLSDRIAAELPGFATEPDKRNVEYTTAPYRDYATLIDRLMSKRCRLRQYLEDLDDFTLVPGSTLSLDPRDRFEISNPDNLYYQQIRDRYGTDVVTASTHLNFGVEDPEELIRVYRVLRCEASSYLALTACSPFFDGAATGYHSTRWHVFPETPDHVPLWSNVDHYVAWFAEQLELGTMFNPRHLWVSARPNGPRTPHDLNRLELRICDRISEPLFLGAVVALGEARIWQILEDPSIDPLHGVPEADHSRRSDELLGLLHQNEADAARASLEAPYRDWRTGEVTDQATHIRRTYEELFPIARAHDFERWLRPVEQMLEQGNPAQRWLAQYEQGRSVREILKTAIEELNEIDHRYDPLCPQAVY